MELFICLVVIMDTKEYEDNRKRVVLFGTRNRLMHFLEEIEKTLEKYPDQTMDIINQIVDGTDMETIYEGIESEYDNKLKEML